MDLFGFDFSIYHTAGEWCSFARSDWLVRMRSVSTILLRAAEETKSPANNLISDHFWYADIDKQIFLVSMRHILKPLLATMSVSGYLHPVPLIIVR